MASANAPPRPAPPSGGFGRTFLIGGSIVAASLAGFYLNMRNNKRKEEQRGKTPYYEQIINHVSKKPLPNEALPILRSYNSNMPPAFPSKEHHSGHATIANYKKTPEYGEIGEGLRYMVPSPQRAQRDGRTYTKSPDYVKNYGKTIRPAKVQQ